MKLIIDISEEAKSHIDTFKGKFLCGDGFDLIEAIQKGTPLDEKEPTYEEVIEYCKKRHLALVTHAFMYRLLNGGDK